MTSFYCFCMNILDYSKYTGMKERPEGLSNIAAGGVSWEPSVATKGGTKGDAATAADAAEDDSIWKVSQLVSHFRLCHVSILWIPFKSLPKQSLWGGIPTVRTPTNGVPLFNLLISDWLISCYDHRVCVFAEDAEGGVEQPDQAAQCHHPLSRRCLGEREYLPGQSTSRLVPFRPHDSRFSRQYLSCVGAGGQDEPGAAVLRGAGPGGGRGRPDALPGGDAHLAPSCVIHFHA